MVSGLGTGSSGRTTRLARATILAAALAPACAQCDPAADRAALVERGRQVFTTRCAPCHGPKGDWPIAQRLKGRTADEFEALFDHLPSVNPIMPPFDAPAADRRAVAEYLAGLHGAGVPSHGEPGADR